MQHFRVGVAILAILLGSGPLFGARPAGAWQWYRSERFGFSLLFPADLFRPGEHSPNGQGLEFTSANGQAKLKILTFANKDNITPSEYRAAIVRNLPGYGKIEYGPMGRGWFVISGVRGASIYYQKVLFACGGRVINAFALTYPEDQKREYDPIVTTIEKNFRPTSGSACFEMNR